MNSSYKYFLLFCFAVFFLSGCNSGKQNTVNVKAAAGDEKETTGQENKTKPDMATTVDVSQMTPEKKAMYMAQAEQIKKLNVGLKTAQRLFDQMWVCLWYAKKNADNTLGECPAVSQLQTVENVFHYSQNLLANIFASNGLPFINVQNKDDCSQKSFRDVLDASASNEFILRRRKCVDLKTKPGDDKKPVLSDRINASQKIDTAVAATVVSLDLFKWTIKSADIFELTFNVESMPEAAGLNLSFTRKNTVCIFEFKDSKILKSLNCKNVGQNKNGNEFLFLENFVYQQQQEIAVQLNGQISTWDGQDYKTEVIRSMTVPLQGEALLEIDRLNTENPPNQESTANDGSGSNGSVVSAETAQQKEDKSKSSYAATDGSGQRQSDESNGTDNSAGSDKRKSGNDNQEQSGQERLNQEQPSQEQQGHDQQDRQQSVQPVTDEQGVPLESMT